MKKASKKHFFLKKSISTNLRTIFVIVGIISSALLITLFVPTGCGVFFDLPRQNPVDPNSPDYDSSPPEITITSHTDSQLVKDPSQVIEGAVSDTLKSVSIIINGEVTEIKVKGGIFSQEILLIEGENTIEVTATNTSLKKSSIKITLILDSTPPEITFTSYPEESPINIPSQVVSGEVVDNMDKTISQGTLILNGEESEIAISEGAFSLSITLIGIFHMSVYKFKTPDMKNRTQIPRIAQMNTDIEKKIRENPSNQCHPCSSRLIKV